MLKLTSEATYQIAGRGTVKVIRNPGAKDPLWRKVQTSKGAEIEIDGERFILLSIELVVPMMHMGEPDAMAYCSTWGLVVRRCSARIDPNRQGPSQPEKSAAERARELLAICGDQSRIYSPGSPEEARKIAARWELLGLTRQILQDLSTATERAEKAEVSLRALAHGATKVPCSGPCSDSAKCVACKGARNLKAWVEHAERAEKERDELLACKDHRSNLPINVVACESCQACMLLVALTRKQRIAELQADLTTSRAAHDKLSEWVRYFCESFEANADRWSIAAWKQKVRGLYEMLPPKETT